jgi:hypothetical protein
MDMYAISPKRHNKGMFKYYRRGAARGDVIKHKEA